MIGIRQALSVYCNGVRPATALRTNLPETGESAQVSGILSPRVLELIFVMNRVSLMPVDSHRIFLRLKGTYTRLSIRAHYQLQRTSTGAPFLPLNSMAEIRPTPEDCNPNE